MKRIPLGECIEGHIYKLQSRNLTLGVFDGRNGFIGIDGDHFLTTEHHWDTGGHCGIASPLEDVGQIDKNVPLTETLGTEDELSGRLVGFDRSISDGGRGWYFLDTDEPSLEIHPQAIPNQPLFKFLERIQKGLKNKTSNQPCPESL